MDKEKKIVGIYPSLEAMMDAEDKERTIWARFRDFLEMDVWDPITIFCRNVKWYFRNKRTFRRTLWNWRPWDYAFQMELFAYGLEQLADAIDHGYEVRESAEPKVAAIKQLVNELRRDYEDEVLEKWPMPDNNTQWIRYDDGTCSSKGKELTKEQEAEYALWRNNYDTEYCKVKDEHYNTIISLLKGTGGNTGLESWYD